jgi:hypothetical protein
VCRVTLHNIDQSDFVQQDANSDLILRIRNAIADLISLVEELKEAKWR